MSPPVHYMSSSILAQTIREINYYKVGQVCKAWASLTTKARTYRKGYFSLTLWPPKTFRIAATARKAKEFSCREK